MKYMPWQALDWQIHSTVSVYSVPVPRFSFVHRVLLSVYADNWPNPSTVLIWLFAVISAYICLFGKHSKVIEYYIFHQIWSFNGHWSLGGLFFVFDLIWESSVVIQLLCVYMCILKHTFGPQYMSEVLPAWLLVLMMLSMWCRQEINSRFPSFIAFCCSTFHSCVYIKLSTFLTRSSEVSWFHELITVS